MTFLTTHFYKKLCYDKITLAGMGVEVLSELIIYINHETLISHWMGTENLLRGGRSIISRLCVVISRGALTQTDSLMFK